MYKRQISHPRRAEAHGAMHPIRSCVLRLRYRQHTINLAIASGSAGKGIVVKPLPPYRECDDRFFFLLYCMRVSRSGSSLVTRLDLELPRCVGVPLSSRGLRLASPELLSVEVRISWGTPAQLGPPRAITIMTTRGNSRRRDTTSSGPKILIICATRGGRVLIACDFALT